MFHVCVTAIGTFGNMTRTTLLFLTRIGSIRTALMMH